MSTPSQHFTLLDLATGQSVFIPLNYRDGAQADTLQQLLQSHNGGRPYSWQAGMDLYADLSNSGNGVATLGLSSHSDICGGRIKAGDPIFTMVCAVSPRMERVAWSHLGRLYFSVLSQNPLVNFASVGDMPDSHPWVAGFAMPCIALLGPNGRSSLTNCVRTAAATLVNRCREVYVPNPNDSLLRDLHEPDSDIGA